MQLHRGLARSLAEWRGLLPHLTGVVRDEACGVGGDDVVAWGWSGMLSKVSLACPPFPSTSPTPRGASVTQRRLTRVENDPAPFPSGAAEEAGAATTLLAEEVLRRLRRHREQSMQMVSGASPVFVKAITCGLGYAPVAHARRLTMGTSWKVQTKRLLPTV
jgi:hypothetical protein